MGKEYYIWRKDFVDMVLKKDVEYDLNILIDVKGKLNQPIFLLPIIEGGGFGKKDIYRS